MSRYTYAGKFINPTEGWYVKEVRGKFEIWIKFDREEDGSAKADRRHNSSPRFEEAEDAGEWIENTREFFEDDYENYLEENHDEIVAMERYEDFKNEY